MRKILALVFLVLIGRLAQGQTDIYNPDSDGNGVITLEDLLAFLSFFDSDFSAAQCNCGCYANPYFELYAPADTLTVYQVASNLFYSQPDSVRLDFVVAPFGTGWMPFLDVDTIYYDTLTFHQTYPLRHVDLDGGYAYSEPHMLFRDESSYTSGVTSSTIHGGLDVLDNSSASLRVEAKSVCPNLQNDEFWFLYNSADFFQVEEGVFVNVEEFASPNIPSQNSAEFPNSWTIRYPLNWIVISAIYNE